LRARYREFGRKRVSDWAIEPFESLGPLLFGTRKGELQRVLGQPPREFQKGFSENVTEAYAARVHMHYDADGTVEFLEAFPPSRPTYRGVDLMQPDAADVVADLAEARPDGVRRRRGWTLV
jgi:catechol 2,3-dioxygenase-like lactoylglutathione lyase family enzyme